MDRKISLICILAAAALILLPISSVVGTNIVKLNNKDKFVDSPLFAIRNKSDNSIKSKFLGQEMRLNIFNTKRSSLQTYIDKSFVLLKKNPDILKSILDKIKHMPEIDNILTDYGLDDEIFDKEMDLIINDNDLLRDKIDEALSVSPFKEDPIPLGLSTSNPLGCFIVALILAPIFALIGAIIATITIITCLNINGCFESIVQSMLDSFIQGLEQP